MALAIVGGICCYEPVGAAGFEPTTSRTRSKRSFLNYCTLVEERKVARRCDAQTTRSRRLSGLIDEAERSSAPFAAKIGGWSGIGRDSGGDAGELQHVLTQSFSESNRPVTRSAPSAIWSYRPARFNSAIVTRCRVRWSGNPTLFSSRSQSSGAMSEYVTSRLSSHCFRYLLVNDCFAPSNSFGVPSKMI